MTQKLNQNNKGVYVAPESMVALSSSQKWALSIYNAYGGSFEHV